MHPMNSYRHMAASRALNEDQMAGITRCFFFMRDVAKSERSIFDQTNGT